MRQLAAENDKLKRLVKKLKLENNGIKEKLQRIEEVRKVENLMKNWVTTRHVEVQTEPRGYSAYHRSVVPVQQKQKKSQEHRDLAESEKLNKMMLMHNNLMKRYEKELRVNVDHVETITKLNLRINSLELKLKEAEMEIHELKIGKQLSKTKRTQSKSARARPRALDASSDSELHSLLDEFSKIKKERDKLQKENKKIKAEIKGLDQNFFDEIEDLKYALHQSAKLNKQYEKSLQTLCSKFGYPYPKAVHAADKQ